MKIDETIEYCNNQAEYCENRIVEWNEKFSNRCKVEAEQYIQIAEWLEELKSLKSEKELWDMQNHRAYQQGRKDAIEEFSKLIKYSYECGFNEKVDRIAEQLKEKTK